MRCLSINRILYVYVYGNCSLDTQNQTSNWRLGYAYQSPDNLYFKIYIRYNVYMCFFRRIRVQ